MLLTVRSSIVVVVLCRRPTLRRTPDDVAGSDWAEVATSVDRGRPGKWDDEGSGDRGDDAGKATSDAAAGGASSTRGVA